MNTRRNAHCDQWIFALHSHDTLIKNTTSISPHHQSDNTISLWLIGYRFSMRSWGRWAQRTDRSERRQILKSVIFYYCFITNPRPELLPVQLFNISIKILLSALIDWLFQITWCLFARYVQITILIRIFIVPEFVFLIVHMRFLAWPLGFERQKNTLVWTQFAL